MSVLTRRRFYIRLKLHLRWSEQSSKGVKLQVLIGIGKKTLKKYYKKQRTKTKQCWPQNEDPQGGFKKRTHRIRQKHTI